MPPSSARASPSPTGRIRARSDSAAATLTLLYNMNLSDPWIPAGSGKIIFRQNIALYYGRTSSRRSNSESAEHSGTSIDSRESHESRRSSRSAGRGVSKGSLHRRTTSGTSRHAHLANVAAFFTDFNVFEKFSKQRGGLRSHSRAAVS